jgi:hypothetical protein
MERAEHPSAIGSLFCVDAPDVVTFRLCLLPFFVKSRYIRLIPEIISNLCKMSDLNGESRQTEANFFHGYNFFGVSLPGELNPRRELESDVS